MNLITDLFKQYVYIVHYTVSIKDGSYKTIAKQNLFIKVFKTEQSIEKFTKILQSDILNFELYDEDLYNFTIDRAILKALWMNYRDYNIEICYTKSKELVRN